MILENKLIAFIAFIFVVAVAIKAVFTLLASLSFGEFVLIGVFALAVIYLMKRRNSGKKLFDFKKKA